MVLEFNSKADRELSNSKKSFSLGETILYGHVVRAATGTFHAECFCCEECGGDLEDGLWIVEGK